MKRWVPFWLLVLLTLAAPAATAQSSSSTLIQFGSLNGQPPVSVTTVPAQTSGQLTVSFHGDPATGCAAQDTCGYSGTVVVRPASGGDFALAKFRIHGRDTYQVQLNLSPGAGVNLTAARVMRAGGGLCSDAQPLSAALTGSITGGQATIGMIQPQGGLLSTRCAGPLDADLAGLGPQIRLSLGQLRSGRRTLPLGGSWSFSADGFAGRIDSNLTMTLGKPFVERPTNSLPAKVFQRDREVTETLSLVSGTGSLSLVLGGDTSACQFLDSCGIQGTISASVAPQGVTASLMVLGPVKRPYADFLAALGLSRRGDPRGLQVNGILDWPGGGTAMEQLQRGVSCTSSGPSPGGAVVLGASERRMTATYGITGSPRTRCPGPELAQFQNLASGSISQATLGHPTFTLHLSGSGALADDGYTIDQRTTLAFTLKRGRVRQHTFLAPAG